MSSEAFTYLIPEMVLVATALAIYLGGAFLPSWRGAWGWIAAGAIGVAALVLSQTGAPGGLLGPLAADALALYGRWLALVVGVLLVMLSARSAANGQTAEIVGSLLLTIVGLMLVAAAEDLILMFVGLELISIPTYVLLYLARRDAAAQESTAKYFYLSILSSALLLYGFSFLYGAAGSVRLDEIYARLAAPADQVGGFERFGILALVLIFAGLGFKIAAAPFHFYAPDVYEGSSHAGAALLAVVPKAAGLIALVRIVAIAMPSEAHLGWQLALVLAVLTMTVGNVLALWQDNLRRLLAYSSIAHAGYMLIGLTVALAAASEGGQAGFIEGTSALLLYLAVYSLASTGSFAALAYLGRSESQVNAVDELAGVGTSHPVTALSLAVFMFSLAGIPILGGFWGKLALFYGAVAFEPTGDDRWAQGWLITLAIIGAINAAIAVAYYLRIVAVMYFRTSRTVPRGEGGAAAALAAALCAVALVAIGLFPGPLVRASNRASIAAQESVMQPRAAEAARQSDGPATRDDLVTGSKASPARKRS